MTGADAGLFKSMLDAMTNGAYLPPVIIFLMFIIFIKWTTLKEYIDRIIDLMKEKRYLKITRKEQATVLLEHPIIGFLYVKSFINIDKTLFPNLSENEFNKRSWCVKTFLKTKLLLFHNHLDAISKDYSKNYIKNTETSNENNKVYPTTEFWFKIIMEGKDTYCCDAKELGVPEVFIDKFETFHKGSLEILSNLINNEIRENKLTTDIEKIHTIFGLFYYALATDIQALNKIMEMNGELSLALENWEIPPDGK